MDHPYFFLRLHPRHALLLPLLFMLCLFSTRATATAFWLDPNPVASPWGRILWDQNLVKPGPGGQLTLNYFYVPATPNLNITVNLPSGGMKSINLDNKAFSSQEKRAINAAAGTWNTGVAKTGNLVGANLGGKFDLQSTALHEFGHVLGLDEPNVGNATKAKNVNVVNPATGAADANITVPKADGTNLQVNPLLQQVVRAAPLPAGTSGTEATMIQGAFANEIQRGLASDDVQGLLALESGKDFTWSTADDYTFLLKAVAEEQLRSVNIFNIDKQTMGAIAGLGTQAFTIAGFDAQTNPKNLTHAQLYLDLGFDPLVNDFIPISITEVMFTSTPDPSNTSNEVAFANVFLNADAMFIPEPGTLALFCAGAVALGVVRRRRMG